MNRRATSIATFTALSVAAVLSVSAWVSTNLSRDSKVHARAAVTDQAPASYIVQAANLDAARAAVNAAGGKVTHELGIIDAVGAQLTAGQAAILRSDSRLLMTVDATARVAGRGSSPNVAAPSYVVRQTQANLLHASGITGKGVGIAFVDTGLWATPLAGYDAINNVASTSIPDDSGHGTHVTSVAASANVTSDGTYLGIAPGASWITVKAFDADGMGTYANAIRGLDWILANKTKYNIRVVNMSFGATAQSYYWNDPLNKAVMKLWQAGIVVVASAGNDGPYAQSITVPGNVPYVITVGAMTDNYSRSNAADDRLASFSSTGPTYEGFVKPEIVAPGGHVRGVMNNRDQEIPNAHPEFHEDGNYFTMSGTSQAAAVVSGTVALMLQAQPSLTPNQVKCKLMSSARAAIDSSGKLAYTVFQQGAGQINAYAAVLNPYTSCANVGLDIAADLAGTKHFGGPARQKTDGTFYVVDASGNTINQQGYLWNNGYLWNQGYLWSNGYIWSNGYLWNNGYLWSNSYVWNNGTLWNQSFVPSTTSVSGVNHWVDQE
jgi:serine protease AprX